MNLTIISKILDMVVEQIKNFNHAAYKKHSKETLKKLKHNHDHFYRDDIPNRIKKEIIEPLLNFL